MDLLVDFTVRAGVLVLFNYSVRERWSPLLLVSILLAAITYVMSVIDFTEAPILHTVWIFIASAILGLSFYGFVLAVKQVLRDRR